MGLLAALDFHSEQRADKSEQFEEIEYRLHSWGEIYPPFPSDREHSIVARIILNESPFKLFSSSTPYDDLLPQKLTLTFNAPWETKKDSQHSHISGTFRHEIAQEFAAFLSVVTRRRIFAVRQIRSNGLPIEQDSKLYVRYPQKRQRLREIDPKFIYTLLQNLQSMDRDIANGYMLALELYHAAIHRLYTEPEFSYLFLVACLETISSIVYERYEPEDKGKFLDARAARWQILAKQLSIEQREILIDVLLANEKYSLFKFTRFIREYLPEVFWSMTEDDAKPDYLISAFSNYEEGERITHSDMRIRNEEIIDRSKMEKTLSNVYAARSRLIHQGIRFPASIVMGISDSIPIQAVGELLKSDNKSNNRLPIPPILTFERLVSMSLVNYLEKCTHENPSGNDKSQP